MMMTEMKEGTPVEAEARKLLVVSFDVYGCSIPWREAGKMVEKLRSLI